jgi:pimeloyl-ACP methyl ester carboxylesterase
MLTFTLSLPIGCSDGLKLATQYYPAVSASQEAERRILCLHGWLDNSRSFHKLAPHLQQADASSTELVALDFPGHGLSAHKSPDGGAPQTMAELVFYVAELVSKLKWDSFSLVGHSMGAAISLMYAASFPDQVQKLVLLEGAGPLYRNPNDFSKHLRAAIERRQIGNAQLFPEYRSGDSNRTKKGPRIYPHLEAAVETRIKTATLSPGEQYLSKEAAYEMVKRATIQVEGGGVQFCHDPRLQWPTLVYTTQQQVEAVMREVQCPTCLLLAKEGWPYEEERLERALKCLQPTVFETLEGSHHFHADPDYAEEVAQRVHRFLEETK